MDTGTCLQLYHSHVDSIDADKASEKSSLESYVSADLPIKTKKEDRLNRGKFSEALAKVTLCVEQRKFALLIPAIYVGAKAGYSCKEADVVIEHGRQSTVEVLAAV